MLHESQLAPWSQHTVQLAQRQGRIADRAQHEGGNHRVELLVRGWQLLGDAVDHSDGCRRAARSLLRECPQAGLRLDSKYSSHRGGVMAEVQPVACADFQHRTSKPGQQLAPVPAHSAAFRPGAEPGVKPGKDWMADRRARHGTPQTTKMPRSDWMEAHRWRNDGLP